jgi:hypothetical protein
LSPSALSRSAMMAAAPASPAMWPEYFPGMREADRPEMAPSDHGIDGAPVKRSVYRGVATYSPFPNGG